MSAHEHLSPQQFYHASPHAFEPGDVLRPGLHDPTSRERGRPGWDTTHVYMAPDEESGRAWTERLHTTHEEAETYLYQVEPHGRVTRSRADNGLPQVAARRARVIEQAGVYGS